MGKTIHAIMEFIFWCRKSEIISTISKSFIMLNVTHAMKTMKQGEGVGALEVGFRHVWVSIVNRVGLTETKEFGKRLDVSSEVLRT